MFTAKLKATGGTITTLRIPPEQFDSMRTRAHGGEIICPGCAQSLNFRVGEFVRAHFYHVNLSPNCPNDKLSAELREGMAVLFELLDRNFGTLAAVERTPDELHPDYPIPRPVDCWVDPPRMRALAYWLF